MTSPDARSSAVPPLKRRPVNPNPSEANRFNRWRDESNAPVSPSIPSDLPSPDGVEGDYVPPVDTVATRQPAEHETLQPQSQVTSTPKPSWATNGHHKSGGKFLGAVVSRFNQGMTSFQMPSAPGMNGISLPQVSLELDPRFLGFATVFSVLLTARILIAVFSFGGIVSGQLDRILMSPAWGDYAPITCLAILLHQSSIRIGALQVKSPRNLVTEIRWLRGLCMITIFWLLALSMFSSFSFQGFAWHREIEVLASISIGVIVAGMPKPTVKRRFGIQFWATTMLIVTLSNFVVDFIVSLLT
jgi:hypothetical protein